MAGPYKRNYGSMLVAKLNQCIRELEQGHGDAYHRVVSRGGDPTIELMRAREAARNKGVAGVPATTFGESYRNRQPDAHHNHITNTPVPVAVCRGCAGTGVDYSVHPWTLQIALGPWNIGPKPGATRQTFTVLHLGKGSSAEPLALLLERFTKAAKEGRSVKHALASTGFPLTSAEACSWCHGTGEPQLSVHSLTTTDGS